MTFSKQVIYLMVITLFACGSDGDGSKPQTTSTDSVDIVDPTQESETRNESGELAANIVFRGYVANGFEVTVDDVLYQDMEDFYSQELDRLPTKVAAAGYKGYDIEFDAELGLTDLWHNMTVFIAPESNRGYQAEALVGRGGEFTASLPVDSNDDEYKVRAYKRIHVLLTNDSGQEKLCYNFSALSRSVYVSDSEKPIILDEFSSRLTKYACDSSDSPGITIPARDADAEPYGVIFPGMTKSEVLTALGDEHLIVSSSTKWCWASNAITRAPVCALNVSGSCPCSVTFDLEGYLSEQQNIDSGYLDIVAW